MRACCGSSATQSPTVPVFALPGTHTFCLRNSPLTLPPQLPAFTAGIVLLLSIWGAKRTGGVPDPAKEMEDVHKCMAVLQAAEVRCVAGSIT